MADTLKHTDLYVNLTEMEANIKLYQQYIDEMTQGANDLQLKLAGLSGGDWHTLAGQNFAAVMNTDWQARLSVFIASMELMKGMLMEIKMSYEGLAQEKVLLERDLGGVGR